MFDTSDLINKAKNWLKTKECCKSECCKNTPIKYKENEPEFQQIKQEEKGEYKWTETDNRLAYQYALETDEGRAALTSSNTTVVDRKLEYLTLARKIFDVHELDLGELPIYDKQKYSPVAVISKPDRPADLILEGENYIKPCIEISAFAAERLTRIKMNPKRSFDGITDKLSNALIDNEDEQTLKLLVDFTNYKDNKSCIVETHQLENIDIESAFDKIIANDGVVSHIIMNPERYHEFVRNCTSFDEATTREILITGNYGHTGTADIHLNKFCPLDTIFFTGVPYAVGIISIRGRVTLLPCDDPNRLKVGYVAFEEIGLSAFDNTQISKIVIKDGKKRERTKPLKSEASYGLPKSKPLSPESEKELQAIIDDLEREMAEDNATPPDNGCPLDGCPDVDAGKTLCRSCDEVCEKYKPTRDFVIPNLEPLPEEIDLTKKYSDVIGEVDIIKAAMKHVVDRNRFHPLVAHIDIDFEKEVERIRQEFLKCPK